MERRNNKRSGERVETPEARNERLAAAKRAKRSNETEDERERRLEARRVSDRTQRANETENMRDHRLQARRVSERTQRANETDEERGRRLEVRRETDRVRVASARENQPRQLNFKMQAQVAATDENTVTEHTCEAMNVECDFCKSLNFKDEKPADKKFTHCCQKGKISNALMKLDDFPDYLKSLMTGEDPESKKFMENIRSMNSSFAFASMGANIKTPPGNGPYCFRIHGQVYHLTGTLHPVEGESKKFAQLYILDPAEAARERLALPENAGCSERVMRNISELLHEINGFARSYKMLFEVEMEAKAEAAANGIEPRQISMILKQDRNFDQRRYNAQKVNEVAIIFENSDGEPPFNRDLLIHLRPDPTKPGQGKTQRINILDRNLDPMTYPLLFPHGEQGWNEFMKLSGAKTRQRLTMMQYYSYRLSRRNEFNPILNAGKLTQQYIVDAYVKMEANRLNFIRYNQKNLRAENYNGLLDHLATDNNNDSRPPGTMVILPSTFEGSPRNMQQRFQDAMAIVTRHGKPDLFITMTCNPKWKDITDNLKQGQRVEHASDLVVRVFRLKLKSLLDDIFTKGLFGKALAKVYVIEFQKRGLPHAHILVILDNDSKLRTEEDIDLAVCAEIPEKERMPRLYDIVMTNMIHGPCGSFNPKSPCMENGKCTKGFPKDFQDSTLGNVDGYPKYRRRKETGVVRGTTFIDNSWVVPYNPYLSLKYNCHINVEICASIKSVKYLFKYVYKGHDCANVEIQEHDEIKNYVDSRYVSAPEAVWRIFSFKMHDQSHTISRLAIHLPNEQRIFFDPNNLENAVQKAAEKQTTLMAYFTLNAKDPNAHEYTYAQIPEHYVYKKNDNTKMFEWTPRVQRGDKVIGRMYTVNVKEGERYFLRLLLLHVRGATSFENLRTVDGVVYESFREAAVERGIFLDDTVWRSTLEDARICQMPKQLRQLFGFICVFVNPGEPQKLWNDFKTFLIEDYTNRHFTSTGVRCEDCRDCEMKGLADLNQTLRQHGKTCSSFRLPEPPRNTIFEFNDMIEPQKEREKAERMIDSLNTEQRIAFDTIVNAINDDSRIAKCFFLDGPGGSGKTYLYSTLIHYMRSLQYPVLASASTGIAANLLIGGRTFYSTFGLPIPLTEISVSRIGLQTDAAKTILNTKLFIIDECTMASSHALNTIDRLLREITQIDVAFGGKVMLLGGDFRQCLTIIPHAQRAAIVQGSLKFAKTWNEFKELKLNVNMRSEDPDYSDWLLRLGDGGLENDDDLGEDVIEIPSELICKDDIVKETFGDEITTETVESMSKRAILCPKNEDVDKLNIEVMDILNGDYKIYLSDDSVDAGDEREKDNFPVEFLNTVTPSGMPSHRLMLKVGAIIILLRNLNSNGGLCNGTRLMTLELRDHVIVAKVLTGSAEGNIVIIPRIDLAPSETGLPFILRRRQFPVKPAFAMSINKAQGQTLDRVGIYLPEPVFGHGQLYVAFSRVRRARDVKIKILDTILQGKLIPNSEKVFTRNVVYKEIF